MMDIVLMTDLLTPERKVKNQDNYTLLKIYAWELGDCLDVI